MEVVDGSESMVLEGSLIVFGSRLFLVLSWTCGNRILVLFYIVIVGLSMSLVSVLFDSLL